MIPAAQASRERRSPHGPAKLLDRVEPGWDKGFSKEALALVDYVLMDPQSISLPGGGYQRIWELQTYHEDTDELMARYLAHCLHVLEREPSQVFGWPLFLPVCIARDYYSLWTQERMQAIVSSAKARSIALRVHRQPTNQADHSVRAWSAPKTWSREIHGTAV